MPSSKTHIFAVGKSPGEKNLCSHSVPIICWMPLWVAILQFTPMLDVDGWSMSGNPDNTYNLLQPIKHALSHQIDQAYLNKFRLTASSAFKIVLFFPIWVTIQ